MDVETVAGWGQAPCEEPCEHRAMCKSRAIACADLVHFVCQHDTPPKPRELIKKGLGRVPNEKMYLMLFPVG